MFWWSYAPRLHALTRTFPLAYTPYCSCDWSFFWLHALMFTYFVDHMHLRSHASVIVCSHVYMLWWSHVHLPVCLQAHMLDLIHDYLPLRWNALYIHMPYWSWAHICTCFDDNILTFLPAFIIICFLIHLLWCSHASIFTWFNYHTHFYVHMLW